MKIAKYNPGVKFLLTTNGIILVAGAMLGPIYALFVKGIGGSLLDASYAGFVFAFVAGIVVLVSGKKVDEYKNKNYIIALGYILMGIGFVSYIRVNNIFFLLIAQAIIGIGEAIYSPTFDAVYGLHLDKHHEGEERGAREAMNYIVGAFGALIGGWIVTHFGFKYLFSIMGLLCLSSAFGCIILGKKYLTKNETDIT